MPTNLEKLRGLLQELFQLDQADLDFGIYRIMNTKRDEIVRFLDKDLLPQVQEAFKAYKPADKAFLKGELDALVANIQNAGMNPDESPKVKELRHKLAHDTVDVAALENEVFSHLFNFFRRYYQDGDFISLRRYKEGVYAIPYEGEEVKLHWANADQYYIKSSETFKDYTFKIESGKRVRVHIVAATTEQDDKKEAPGKERRFVLCSDKPLVEQHGELFIRFEYRPSEGKEKQDELNQQAIEAILKTPGFEKWAVELGRLAPTDKDKNRTVLQKHLTQYTARNTFDYFIHKDLEGFLRRELDFYIKNEVMHLDDIQYDSAPKVEQYLSQIRVIRNIAHKIIAFLEQLENFQKKLWLKKKFVVETNYCITLDKLPEEFYPAIAKNDAQCEEWVRLFAIDTIKGDMHSPGYSKPLTTAFLKANRHLQLDTRFFDPTTVNDMLSAIDQLDQSVTALLISSDNFHAINLLSARFKDSLPCIYIDPPYNTSENTFLYKNQYRHSSWMSMMASRVALARGLLKDSGVFCAAIDDTEHAHLRLVLEQIFAAGNRAATIAAEVNPAGQNLRPNVPALSHDYTLVFAKNIDEMDMLLRGLTPEEEKLYAHKDEKGTYLWDNLRRRGGNSRPTDRPKQWYPLYASLKDKKVSIEPFDGAETIWPIDPQGEKRIWRNNRDGAKRDIASGDISVVQKAGRTEIVKKSRMPEGKKPKTFWDDPKYSATTHGTKLLIDILGNQAFSYPKSIHLVQDCLRHWIENEDTVFDFFAGSGTTAHAITRMNREDGGGRKVILAEVGLYFEEVLKKRVQRVAYSSEWDRGKPVGRDGTSQIIKYITIESYEDALNNLELNRTEQQSSLLNSDPEMREQYTLSYMLDVESRGSQSLLNVTAFRNPDQYKLKVERNGENQLVNVDLAETFNWLLGLTVRHIDVIRGVRVIDGTNPQGERVLVLWRNLDEMDNDKLDKWFKKQDYNTQEMIYDLFYVNGDNNLENLRRSDQTWKVRLIEEEFQRLMFDVQGV